MMPKKKTLRPPPILSKKEAQAWGTPRKVTLTLSFDDATALLAFLEDATAIVRHVVEHARGRRRQDAGERHVTAGPAGVGRADRALTT